MSTVRDFLADLSVRDIKLWADGEQLRCNAPKGSLTPALLQKISERKADILSFLRRTEQEPDRPPIKPVLRNESIPLSFAQQRLWFLDHLQGPNATYNIFGGVRLSGTLNVKALCESLNVLARRHEVLRTTFLTKDGSPVQQIAPAIGVDLPLIDLQAAVDVEAEVRKYATQEAQQFFDLATGPLWRALLLRLGPAEHVLLLTMHHIISDGWSFGILVRELSSLYEAFSQGKPSDLPKLAIQYTDFAVWQRQWLQGKILAEQLSYWQQQLAAAPPFLPLPTDHPHPPIQSFRGANYPFSLPKELSSQLQALSVKSGVTLFMTLLTAFNILLMRYAGQEDILVGTPIANRHLKEIEPLIGFFVNTLVLRSDLSGNPTFLELLGRVRQTALDAYKYQDLPFERLIDALQLERNLSYNPLFTVMFVLQNTPIDEMPLGGLTLTPLQVPRVTAKFNLTLSIEEKEGQLQGEWEYSTDIFEHDTIRRMSGHFQTLLAGMVANPTQRIGQLPLLTEAERHKLLVEWNDTAADYPTDQCIHHLFEEQVERTPDATAVVFGDQKLTYRELNAKANQLAHYLMAQGVGPDVLVGICVERSLEMVFGLLGILKAGGAYVPLDPNYPAERLAFMFSDTQVKLVLTQAELRERLSVLTGPSVLDINSQWPPSERSHENPAGEVEPTNLAYVIYTSGSTGRPKGVQICHRAICNHMFWIQKTFAFAPSDKVLHKTPFSFDASVWEFYAPLLVGGQLVIARPFGHQDSTYMLSILQSQKITILQLVPTQLRMLVEAGGLSQCDSLKYLFCGGEALPVELVRRFKSLNGAQVTNLYGPTEACIDATFWVAKDQSEMVPIGRPIGNYQAYVLDSHLQPVPIGVSGELYIGGAGLARGYLNRPQLTKEKFIANPFGPGRLYKTGDLCRYLPDGNIEFLGRADYQVKIRGFRIELGEIEAQLSQYELVREVVVVVRSEPSGPGQRLVAYFVAEEPISSSTLRSYLGQKLSDYMIPKVFMQIKTMPLTTNGKINRRALPAPEIEVDSAELVLPRTPLETILATIWQEVLGLKEVGVRNNFFEVGGDSIISIQIVSRAKEAGIKITPRDLFQHQTIGELASVAREAQKTASEAQQTSAGSASAASEQGVVTGRLPLTPIQHWFLEQKWQEPHHFNQSILLYLTREVKESTLSQAVQELLAHHDALRLRFEHQGDSWQQALSAPEPKVPFEVINLSAEGGSEQVAILEKANQLQASLNLSQGPLVRVALFQSSTANRLLIVIHHLAVDGVSWRILLEDLQRAYQQVARGERIQLPAKSTSFKRWATLLNEKGPSAHQAERHYWAMPATPPLPVDYRLGPNDNASAANISTRLTGAQTSALLNKVPAVYHTQINDLLLTALVLAFQEWTGEAALLLNLEGHGREELFEVDLSRTVGWFTTIFPVRLELTTSSLGEAIKRVKEQLRRIPNRGIGYGILRYLSKNKVPEVYAEVSFNYLGQFDQSARGTLILGFASESSGLSHSRLGQRTHLLDINGVVLEGQLQVDWTYSRNFHRSETIQKLANGFIDALAALIAHCQEPEAGGYTPSDFPEAELNQEELDDLLSILKV